MPNKTVGGTAGATELETGKRIAVLDGWRGMSILLVLIGHFFPSTLRLLNLGTFGVECFFVLSGRLMAEILFIRRGNLREFYLRRLSRVIPAFWLFVVSGWAIWSHGSLRLSVVDVMESLTFTYNYFSSITRHHVEIIDHVWSLCVEEHTYAILGLLAIFSRRFDCRAIRLLIPLGLFSAADIVASSFIWRQDFAGFWRTDCHLFSIVFGSISYIMVREGASVKKWLKFVSPVAFILAVTMSASRLPVPLAFIVVAVLLSAAVVSVEYAPTIIQGIMLNPGLRFLGGLSFSVYLWQEPFFKIAMISENHAVRLLMLGVAVVVGALSFYLVERPSRRWLNRLISS